MSRFVVWEHEGYSQMVPGGGARPGLTVTVHDTVHLWATVGLWRSGDLRRGTGRVFMTREERCEAARTKARERLAELEAEYGT